MLQVIYHDNLYAVEKTAGLACNQLNHSENQAFIKELT